ncbi:hypothetical protein CO670_15340 [Rhizobium sp. J15]|uniref:hypothetical protein n=1 Tax=Rhizobium sp. J15 TaxID=2035450 RepID=UPI000BE9A8C1|nr:hypothetical protein [Rhizobium sp. J15]PDT15869.1 hypothetical protein CO670_15340 [Rhizobium sp. J15]
MMSSIETIITAAQKAQAQFSVIHGSQTDNEEIVKELAVEMMKALSGLVYDAGGDPDYLEPWIDGIADDIDRSFQSAREPVVTRMFRPRRGLGSVLVKGANLQAAE